MTAPQWRWVLRLMTAVLANRWIGLILCALALQPSCSVTSSYGQLGSKAVAAGSRFVFYVQHEGRDSLPVNVTCFTSAPREMCETFAKFKAKMGDAMRTAIGLG